MLFSAVQVDDALKEAFDQFRQDPLNTFRVNVRRTRATQLRQLLTNSAAIDVATFQREVWNIETDTYLRSRDIHLSIFGQGSLIHSGVEQLLQQGQVTLPELEVALTSGDLELHGNYVWRQGASIYASKVKDAQEKLRFIQQALQILNNPTLSLLSKAHALKAVYGFGENNATGLVMIFYPNEFPLINSASRGTLKKLGLNITASTPLEEIQQELTLLKESLGAGDFLELDWFLYLYTFEEVSENKTWFSYVKEVLEDVGRPLRISEITESVIIRGIPTKGKTPERTVSRILTTNSDTFERVSDGEYRLRQSRVIPGGEGQLLDTNAPVSSVEEYVEPSFEIVHQAITDQGMHIDERTLRRYHLSLKTRGFVILSGPSGTGKTWLTEAYANAVQAMYLAVPVAPNWTTNEDLLGFADPYDSRRYRHTSFSLFLESAAAEYELAHQEGRTPRPYHLVLDEMNLARPEYYFAKFLSTMEVSARQEAAIIELGEKKTINIYRNLFFIGTINVDETTHGFADKVYDRAQLIEMTISREALEKHMKHAPYSELLLHIWDAMQAVAPFAFRVLTEIASYVEESEKLGISWQEAVDEQILQKILPKCKGIDSKVDVALERLDALLSFDEFPLSKQKLQYMIEGYKQNGIASYF